MRIFCVIEDLFRYQRRWLLTAAAAIVAVAGVAFVVTRLTAPGVPTDPFGLALAVCEGPERTFDPDVPSPQTWTGSHGEDSAELRCHWPAATAGDVSAHLESLGYTDPHVATGVVDYLGRDGAWVVNVSATGNLPGVSVGGLDGTDTIDVVIGGFIHVHEDGTVHRHDVDGTELPG